MKNAIGHKRWAIAEGYIPEASHVHEPEMTSHETACLLNRIGMPTLKSQSILQTGSRLGLMFLTVPAKRTKHFRFNDLRDPAPVPRGTDYASLIESTGAYAVVE
jgi:hypothetical protein